MVQGAIPVGELAVVPPAAPLTGNGMLNVKMTATAEAGASQAVTFKVEGERVDGALYARIKIQYRRGKGKLQLWYCHRNTRLNGSRKR